MIKLINNEKHYITKCNITHTTQTVKSITHLAIWIDWWFSNSKDVANEMLKPLSTLPKIFEIIIPETLFCFVFNKSKLHVHCSG